MATNEQIQKALKSIGCNPYMNPESYRTIREVLQDALNPWNYNMDEAPKDGTKILVYENNDIYAVYWSVLVDEWVIFGDVYSYKPVAWTLPQNPQEKIK